MPPAQGAGPALPGIPPEVETAAVATGTALAELEKSVAATATALAGVGSVDPAPSRGSLPPIVLFLLVGAALGGIGLMVGAIYFLTKNRSPGG